MIKKIGLLILLAAGSSCSHGKMGLIETPLDPGSISKTTPIYVLPVDSKNMSFTGDAINDPTKLAREKADFEDGYYHQIVQQLVHHGFNAKVARDRTAPGLYLSGVVSLFEHGSGAARFWVGMGAGSSNLYSDFLLKDSASDRVITKFQIIATSGGESGPRSYLENHMKDGAEKIAKYFETGK